MKTTTIPSTKYEESLYFGLWRSCNDTRAGDTKNTTNRPMLSVCKDFGNYGHAGIVGTPDFLKQTRACLVLMIIVMGITSLITAFIMFTSDRAMLYWNSPFSLAGSIIGITILAIFVGKMENSTQYEDFYLAWSFFYFLIGWLFTLSAVVTSVLDKPIYKRIITDA